MNGEEHFPQPGLVDICDELMAAQHFRGLAAMYRFEGQESEATEYDSVSTRHWQRAGWIAEALVNSSPAPEPTSDTEPGRNAQDDPPTEAPVTNTAAPIQPEPDVGPVLRARHLVGTVDELPAVGGSLEELPVALTSCFTADTLKPERLH